MTTSNMQGNIDFADLQGTQNYSMTKAYTQSKLAQIYSTYELAESVRRMKGIV